MAIDLTAEVHQQIQQVADQLAGPDRPGETWVGKTGRLKAAELAARELVYQEMGEPQSPESPGLGGYPMEPVSPEDQALDQAMRDFAEAQSELEAQNRISQRQAMPILPSRTPPPAPTPAPPETQATPETPETSTTPTPPPAT